VPGKGVDIAVAKKIVRTLSIRPDLWEDAQKIADVELTSISAVISEYLERYVEMNTDKLKEYDRIKNEKKSR